MVSTKQKSQDLNNSMIKSPIKWAGGKSWLIERINQDCIKLNPETFIDVFTGSGIVALNSPCKNVVANDINHALITFHKTIKAGSLNLGTFNLTEQEYYNNRNRFNQIKNSNINDIELSVLFYYINKTCFNGLYRENSKGEFNVPWGKKKKLAELKVDHNAYSKIIFKESSYELLDIPSNSFMYLDPPYDTPFTKYSKGDFTWKNQVELLNWALSKNNNFAISNQATDRIIKLYKDSGLNVDILYAPRRISANGNRDKVKEVYAKNF